MLPPRFSPDWLFLSVALSDTWVFSYLTLCVCFSALTIAPCCQPRLSAALSPSLSPTPWRALLWLLRSFPSGLSSRLLVLLSLSISCVEALSHEQPCTLL